MTLFGEISEPSSRALYDFEESLGPFPVEEEVLKWEGVFDPPSTISLLVFAEGNPINKLFQQCVTYNSQLICSCKTLGIQIYRINEPEGQCSKYVCLIEDKELYGSGQVIEILRAWIEQAANVISFVALRIIDYQTRFTSDNPAFLLRMLQTPNQVTKFKVGRLEQPNIIPGKSAGLLSYRLFRDMPATIFILYLQQMEMDSTTSEPILALLNLSNISSKKFIGGLPKPESNLYL